MDAYDEHDQILAANSLFPLKRIFAAFLWRHGLENILKSVLLVVDSLARTYLSIPGKEDEGKRLKLVTICLQQAQDTWQQAQSWDSNELDSQLVYEEEEKLLQGATFTNQLGSLTEEIRAYQLATKGNNNGNNIRRT